MSPNLRLHHRYLRLGELPPMTTKVNEYLQKKAEVKEVRTTLTLKILEVLRNVQLGIEVPQEEVDLALEYAKAIHYDLFLKENKK